MNPKSPFFEAVRSPELLPKEHPKTVRHIAEALKAGNALDSSEVAELFVPPVLTPTPAELYSMLVSPRVRAVFVAQHEVDIVIYERAGNYTYFDRSQQDSLTQSVY